MDERIVLKRAGRWKFMAILIIILGLTLLFPKRVLGADAGTRSDALKWAYAQEGKYLDYDGAYGAQCVDLIKYYYAYFGKASYAKGNGCQYVNNALPEGWSRIQNTPDFVPQPGDIAVWGTELSKYGHVAIILSANKSSFVSMDQNWPTGSPCKQVSHTYSKFWGVIRPNFTNSYNNPIGCLDSCSGGEGSVTVAGWAFDNDSPGTCLDIHVYVGGPAGSGAPAYIIKADKSRSDVEQAYPGVGANHGFRDSIKVDRVGKQEVYVYAINVGGGYNNTLIGSGTATITENQRPVIDNVRIENCTADGYTVYCDVSDNTGISSVKFPTWSNTNGQDDLKWYEGTVSGNVASCRINVTNHNNETNCYYITHIYAYDVAGNLKVAHGGEIYVDSQPPVISNIKISNVNTSGFDVSCKITDNYSMKRVMFPIWTKEGGQDDLPSDWPTNGTYSGTIDGESVYYHVNTSDHNNETGIYFGHIYADDKYRNREVARLVVYVGDDGYGLTPVLTKMYEDHTYLLFEGTNCDGDKLMDWTEAAAYCQSIGGTLACITSAEENAVVASMVSSYGDTCWIGGNDLETEGEFVWETGEDFSYTNWSSGNPDNYGEQDFVRMYTNGRWDDCESVRHAFICELVTPAKSIEDCTVILSDNTYIYDGTAKIPSVTVKYGENILEENTDYTLSYSDNTNAGIASVTITGIEKYKGEITRSFTINKATQKININVSTLDLKEGMTAQIEASSQGILEFTSSNTDIATVSPFGLVTGKANGSTVITVTAPEDNNYDSASTSIPVTVTHDYDDGVITAEATCTEDGIRTYTCSACGKTYTEALKATGHTYGEETVEPTCTERGYTTHSCSVCGDHYRDHYVDALGHTFDDGVITTPATDEAEGIKTYTCARCGEKKTEIIPAITHTYDDGEIIQAATCTEPGVMLYKCTDCDKTYTVEIPALGHQYETTVTEATCVKKGYTKHTCTNCGDTYRDAYTSTIDHSYDNGEIIEEPTCTEEGLKLYTCTVCKNQYTESIAEKGHQYETTVILPTCTKKGYTIHTCSICRNSYRDAYTKEAAHSYNEGEIIEEPTCIKEGLKIYTCDVCRNQYTEIISAKGHSYEETVTAPDCTQKGYTTHKCSVCGNSYKDTYTDAKGHTWDAGELSVEPGCETTGTKIYRCTVCNVSRTEEVPPLGHEIAVDEAKAANCLESGLTDGIHCSRCGAIFKAQEVIPAKGHTYGEWTIVKEAGCTEAGEKERICIECGEKETERMEAAGHLWNEGTVTIEPQCNNAGVRTFICDNCGETRTEAISATGHTIVVDEAKAAGCTESGLTEGSHCSRCGAVLKVQEEIPALGHNYGEWTIIKEAGCTEEGEKERSCDRCGGKEEEKIEATGHTVVIDAAKAASCTESGLTEGSHCSKCGTVLKAQKEISATGHHYSEWMIKDKATCTEKGQKERICSACGEKQTEWIAVLGHNWDAGVIIKAATEQTDGVKKYTCKICGEIKTGTVPALKKDSADNSQKPSTVEAGTIINDENTGGTYRITLSGTVEFYGVINKYVSDIRIMDVVSVKDAVYQVTAIAPDALKNNKKIVSVSMGCNIKSIGDNAFSGCSRLKKVTIGKGVKTIGAKAFYKCKSLTKITIPAKVTGIGKQAFYGCKKLKNIDIRAKRLTSKNVGSKAFKGIHRKARIKVPKTKLKVYKKLLKAKGAGKKVKIVK